MSVTDGPDVVTAAGPVVDALRGGACVGIPTDTVYGLAASLAAPDAVEALFALKGRAATKAMAVLVADLAAAERLAHLDASSRRLAERFWPGPLTMVLRRQPHVVVDLGGDQATIGVRCPALEIVREIAAAVGPLVTTSANRTGEPTLGTAAEIAEVFGDRLGCVLDGGLLGDAASTVVDLCGPGVVVLREGPITTAQLLSKD
jgi:tRNA threonylcarbamoyl adenosine modification protein (Sua5/YciO/YrdC/YwlC family)